MHERRVGSVVVVEGPRPVGILTERDLVRFAAGAADARTALVGDYMSPDPDTVEQSEEVIDAFRRLAAHGYRHIPVVPRLRADRILTMRDLVLTPRGPPCRPRCFQAREPPWRPCPGSSPRAATLCRSSRWAGPRAAIVFPGGPEVSTAPRRHVAEGRLRRRARHPPRRSRSPRAAAGTESSSRCWPRVPAPRRPEPLYNEDEFRVYFATLLAGSPIVPPGAMEAARRACRRRPRHRGIPRRPSLRLAARRRPVARRARAAPVGRRGPRAAHHRATGAQARPLAPAEPRASASTRRRLRAVALDASRAQPLFQGTVPSLRVSRLSLLGTVWFRAASTLASFRISPRPPVTFTARCHRPQRSGPQPRGRRVHQDLRFDRSRREVAEATLRLGRSSGARARTSA